MIQVAQLKQDFEAERSNREHMVAGELEAQFQQLKEKVSLLERLYQV